MTEPLAAALSGGISTELLGLAQRIRHAISGESGVIELNSCLDVAYSLDRLSASLSHDPALTQPSPIVPEVYALTAADVMRTLDLAKLGHAVIIAELANSRGATVSCDELAVKSGYTPSSLYVMIFQIRQQLENRQFPIAIKARRRRGYYMKIDDAAWVCERVGAYFSEHAIRNPGVDEAYRLFCELDAAACLEALFVTLAGRVGDIVSYEELQESHRLSVSTLKVYASRLRHVLNDLGYPKLIENVSSLGYRMQADVYQALKAHLLPQ